jgi:integrase
VLIFRRAVPPFARSEFGRGEVHVSFDTSNLTDARYRLAREVAKFDDKLNRAKRARASAGGVAAPLRVPSNVEIEEVVRAWLVERLARAKQNYTSDGVAIVDVIADLHQHSDDVRRGARIGSGDIALTTQWIAEAIIEQNGWDIHPETGAFSHLLRMVSRGQREADSQQLQDIEGDPIRVTDETFSPDQYQRDSARRLARTSAPLPIFDMFDGYVTEKKPKPSTVRAWRRQIARLVTFIGHDDARRMTPEHMQRWKEHLLTVPNAKGQMLSARTVKDTYLAAAKTILGWAAENGHIEQNPVAKIRVRVPRQSRTRDPGYNNDEAARILRASDEPPSGKLSSESAFAYRWVPWLCAYTGARVNEITQLRKQDVFQVEGHWVILITPEAGTVKGGSHRYVPLHSALIRRGFILEVADKPAGPLFFDLGKRRGGSDENPQPKKVGERIALWVRDKCGVSDPVLQPNHAWRHRFKSLARKYRMDAEIRDVIQGHSPRTEGEGYGTREHIELMAEAIELLP